MTATSQRSGNAFTGLGVQDPEEHALKAELLRHIAATIEAQQLTQRAAGERLGIGQPEVSRMLGRNFRTFSVERLMHFLVILGQDIEIRVIPAQPGRSEATRITVIAG
jgi:predicted XRE-type DNA-binding protein